MNPEQSSRLSFSLSLCLHSKSQPLQPPPSVGHSVLSAPGMSQHVDPTLHFQENGLRLSKHPICPTIDKNLGMLYTQWASSGAKPWDRQPTSFGKYLAGSDLGLLGRAFTPQTANLCKRETDSLKTGWWWDKGGHSCLNVCHFGGDFV